MHRGDPHSGHHAFQPLGDWGTIHSFAKEYPGVTAVQAQDVVTFAGRDMVRDPHAAERARADAERLDVERTEILQRRRVLVDQHFRAALKHI